MSWLERDGGLVTGGVFWDVKIYDGITLIKTLTYNTEEYRLELLPPPEGDGVPYSNPIGPDASGTYKISWEDTGLEGGKTYIVVTRIQIGTGGTFNTPSALDITASKQLQDMEDTVKDRLDIPMSQVRGEIQETLNQQTEIIQEKMDTQVDIIQQKMDEFTGAAEDLQSAASISLISASKLEEAAAISEAASLDLQNIAKRQSARLLIPQTVITGEPAKIRYRAYSPDSIPLLDLINFENAPIVLSQPMSGVPNNPGLFEYEIEEVTSDIFEPGSPFTVIVKDDLTNGVESGAIYVEAAAGKLLLPNTVLMGDRVILRFRGRGGWKPVISMLNFEGKEIVKDAKMTPLAGKEKQGYFEYVIPSIAGDLYAPGKPVTVTVMEPTTATLESGTFMVETTSLSSLEGLVASGAGAKSVAQDALDAIIAVQGSLTTGGDVGSALENIKYKLNRIPKEIAEEGITAPIVNKVNEIKDQFAQFAGEEGYDFSTLLEQGLSESATVGEIRTTTDRINGASDVMSEIIQRKLGGTDEAFVEVILE